MIRLILFAACEKVIVGEDHRSTLISVLEGINVRGEAAENIPETAVMPFKWTAIALWHRDKPVGKTITYEARVSVVMPSGKIVPTLTLTVPFDVSDEFMNFRNTFSFGVLPIGENGIYHILLSYRKASSSKWIKVGDQPVRVIHAELADGKNATK